MDGHPAPQGADRIPPTGRLTVTTRQGPGRLERYEMGPVWGRVNFGEDMANRDTVLNDSSIHGQSRLAELLLNAGLSDNEQSEWLMDH